MVEIYPIEPYLPPETHERRRQDATLLSISAPIPEMMAYFRECRATMMKTKDLKACHEISEILDKMRETMLNQSKVNAAVITRKFQLMLGLE